MEKFNFSKKTNAEKVFLTYKSEIIKRFDPSFYEPIKASFFKLIQSKKSFVKLKDILDEGSYGILPPGDSYNEENPVTFIRATELRPDLNIDVNNAYKVKEQYFTKRARVKKNDILLAVKGATIAGDKCVAFIEDIDFPAIVNGSIFRFQVKENINAKYIALMMNSMLLKKQMKYNLVANNAVDYLDKNLIYNLLIPLPDKETQENIIELLESGYRRKQEKEYQAKKLIDSIDNYLLDELSIVIPKVNNSIEDRIFTTTFKEVSGNRIDSYYNSKYFKLVINAIKKSKCPIVKLSEISNKITDGTHHTPKYTKNGARFISVKNIKKSKIDFNDIKYTSLKDGEKLERRVKPESNDILLTKIGTIGKTCVIKKDDIPFNIFVSLALIRPNSMVSSYYLSEVLGSSIGKLQFYRHLKGIGVPDLHLENIATTLIPLPKMEKQKEIADKINSMRVKAEQLNSDAKRVLEEAKNKIEQMILN